MNKVISIVKQYNKSKRDDTFLKNIQKEFIASGSYALTINNKDYIIQKCPELFYKALDITNVSKDLNLLLTQLPQVFVDMTIDKLLEEELVQTNNIESIHTDRASVRDIIAKKPGSEHNREAQIVNHYMQILSEELCITTPEDISTIYYNFLKDYIQKEDLEAMEQHFRAESVNIVTGTGKIIHTGIEGEQHIYDALTNLLTYLANTEENIYIKVAVFHYLFGYIHPFYDGNGRMVRLITASLLFPEINIASLAISETIANNQSTYYQMFDETNSRYNINDLTSFVYQFLTFVEDSIQKTMYHLRNNKIKIENFNDSIDLFDMKNRDKLILSVIYQASLIEETMTASKLINIIGISRPTILKILKGFEDNNFISIDTSIKSSPISINLDWVNSIIIAEDKES